MVDDNIYIVINSSYFYLIILDMDDDQHPLNFIASLIGDTK